MVRSLDLEGGCVVIQALSASPSHSSASTWPQGPRSGSSGSPFLLQSTEGSPVQPCPSGLDSRALRLLAFQAPLQAGRTELCIPIPPGQTDRPNEGKWQAHLPHLSTLSLIFFHSLNTAYVWVEGLLIRPYLQIVQPHIHYFCLPKHSSASSLSKTAVDCYFPVSARALGGEAGEKAG